MLNSQDPHINNHGHIGPQNRDQSPQNAFTNSLQTHANPKVQRGQRSITTFFTTKQNMHTTTTKQSDMPVNTRRSPPELPNPKKRRMVTSYEATGPHCQNKGLKMYILNKWSKIKQFDGILNTIDPVKSDEIVPLELNNSTNQRLDMLVPSLYDRVNHTTYEIVVPDAELSKLTHVTLTSMEDLKNIPNESGCYWIMTNEPIRHCFNSGSDCPGVLPDGFSVVYNGITVGMRGRAKQHLLRQDLKGSFGSTSGISVDLLKETDVKKGVSKSHVKWMWQNANAAKKHKLPKVLKGGQYCQMQRDASKQDIMDTLHLSETEKEMAANREELIFKNGINVADQKHALYTWKFVFVPISVNGVRDYVECTWRKMYGVPSLCTYKEGR